MIGAKCPEETWTRKKKILRVFWSFRVSVHVGMSELSAMLAKMDMLACHISEKDIFECGLK
jgi:hypothetical protein